MRFALLGNHPDGLAMAKALVATSRYTLTVVCDVEPPPFAPEAKRYPELEEVLADPAVELVIVAVPMAVRAEQLRRAVQSERDVLCVHPSAEKPDPAYEAALIHGEAKRLLMPLIPEALHPCYARLRELLGDDRLGFPSNGQQFRIVSVEHWATSPDAIGPDWTAWRRIGGEVVEVSGLAPGEEIEAAKPLIVCGRFENGALIQATYLPAAAEARRRFAVRGATGAAELEGPDSHGHATLRWQTANGGASQVTWGQTDCWPALVEAVELARSNPVAATLSWLDEIRALELNDALRRSVAKRRTSSLEYQEINEEIGGKGTLTLIGCGMIWLVLLLAIMAIWQPLILWAVVPLLLAYLVLLGMNWLARARINEPKSPEREAP